MKIGRILTVQAPQAYRSSKFQVSMMSIATSFSMFSNALNHHRYQYKEIMLVRFDFRSINFNPKQGVSFHMALIFSRRKEDF
jgi:hypothetical protein